MTPWGWGVGPRSPTYSETDLTQGQVPGYPPPADVPGNHSSLGNLTLTYVGTKFKGKTLSCVQVNMVRYTVCILIVLYV
jgi:hypothetical protein